MSKLEKEAWLIAVSQARRIHGISQSGLHLCYVLVAHLGRDGQLDLSHEKMAELARCSVITIGRQLRQLRKLGFIEWKRRIVRFGACIEQTSNAYVLTLPAAAECDPLEQNDGQDNSYLNIPLSTFIRLKAARVQHNAVHGSNSHSLYRSRARRVMEEERLMDFNNGLEPEVQSKDTRTNPLIKFELDLCEENEKLLWEHKNWLFGRYLCPRITGVVESHGETNSS